MALIVQKFGGTSVGSIDRIKNAAARALDTQRAGNDVVVIVSAMAGETNRLLKLAADITSLPDSREVDALAASGEQVSAALMSIATARIRAQRSGPSCSKNGRMSSRARPRPRPCR